MKKLLIILLFIPILSFSQNIGEKLPKDLIDSMDVKQSNLCKIYTYWTEDSSVVIGVDIKDDLIFTIDYIISKERVGQTGLNWLKPYKLVARNAFYDYRTGDFYFMVVEEDKFYIQRRNEKKI